MSYRILVCDDDKSNQFSTKAFLESHGFVVTVVDSGRRAIDALEAADADYALVLMDYLMPEMNGGETVRKILSQNPDQLIAMYSCDDSRDTLKDSLRSGVVDFIDKSADPAELLKVVRALCAKYDQTTRPILPTPADSDAATLIQSIGMVGCSTSLAKVAVDVHRFANESQTVLITGETGTGKEEVAKALHRLSDRKPARFEAINCAAIPENLLESILFGHERGAFTGADKKQPGKFLLAHKGTVFLDEIGDLPLQLQAKLLRVLQERTVEAVGSTQPVPVDVRVIAATHKNLEQLVKEGKFREDLYYRLNVLIIAMPPLRQRPEDIEPLVAHFSFQHCQARSDKKRFEKRTLSILQNYRWPGNVRELKNAVDSHLIRCPGTVVKPEHLDAKFFQALPAESTSLSVVESRQKEELKNHIRRVLAQSQSKSDAARKMGISPSRLHYYLENYQITTVAG